jgi:NADH-quinone oxidoreductase subunit F
LKEKQEILEITEEIVANIGREKHHAIPILQAMQEKFNYLPKEGMERVCEITEISASQLTGISTFYNYFRHKPAGKHNIRVCVGTACHVKGAVQVHDAIKRELKIGEHEDTDKEGLFTVEKVACLGCCTIAPVVQIDDVTYGHVSTEKAAEIIEDFKVHGAAKESHGSFVKTLRGKSQGEIRIGLGSCCVASGSEEVKQALEKSLSDNRIEVDVKHVGCVGVCNQVPMLEIHKANENPTFYTKIKPEEVNRIIKSHFSSSNLWRRLTYGLLNTFENLVLKDLPVSTQRYDLEDVRSPLSEFIREQVSIATEHRGELNPSDLNEYRLLGGFSALEICLAETDPLVIIDRIEASGLQGRGGGGFPTGQKWRLVSQAEGSEKYVICNGDEGDPGAFMDRMLLESYPFRIIEGVLIAALAVGATKAYFYIRAEYPLAVKRIREGLDICQRAGLTGKNILGSGFSLDIDVFEGAGAFICGEETALIASIEGGRGMPKMRPPYPAEKGLWNQPTLINNTETFALVPWIINNGADKFSAIGTENSKGTKVFALAGKVNRGGLIEVPMGISIRKIVEEIGGGISGGKKFKAVQIGGPSGGCIPASMADIPIDFESLKEVGAMMGSGGLIVLDETDCMVDIARYFLAFTQDQSCGKCTFCRIGTKRMLEIFDRIVSGKGTMKDLDQLEELSYKTIEGSICGLGTTAPNPVLTTLKYFREEYEMHVKGKCPTGKCTELIHYEIDDTCIGCTICAQKCPVDAIENKPYEIHSIDLELCVKCDICRQVCPEESVKIV